MRDDFDFETARGLPAQPPGDERVLWQGAPDWRTFARHVFKLWWITAYFALAIGWQFATALHDGTSISSAFGASAFLVIAALAVVGIFAILAWAIAKTTVYTVTSKRLVFKVGVALPMTINVPFAVISNAGMKPFKNGAGNIAFELEAKTRIPYFALWPHARPWRMGRTEPTLRCIADAEAVSKIVADAYRQATESRMFSVDRTPEPAPSGFGRFQLDLTRDRQNA